MTGNKELAPFFFGAYMVRVVPDGNGEYWFVAKDILNALNYGQNSNPSRVIAHVPQEWRGHKRIMSPSGAQEMLCLSEQGLYFFLGRSDKPKALPFQKWLAGEVLPSIRKTGSYEMGRGDNSRGRVIRQNVSTPFPEKLPDEVLALRPHMRQTLWHNALQTARLESADAAYAWEVFLSLCRMVGAKNTSAFSAIPDKAQEVAAIVSQFARENLEPAPGSRISSGQLYKAFSAWMDGRGVKLPSQRLFGEIMGTLYGRMRSNGTWYEDVAFKQRVYA